MDQGPLEHRLITHGYLSNRSSASVVHQSMIIYTEKHMSKSVSFCFSSIADLRCLFCLNTYRDRFEYYIRLSEIEFLSPTIIRQQLLESTQFNSNCSHIVYFSYIVCNKIERMSIKHFHSENNVKTYTIYSLRQSLQN